jgi:hypothetical protein
MLPKTSQHHYITGTTALNVPLPEEGYGDWHFNEAFYGRGSHSPKIFMAGKGEKWNSDVIFGDWGIYECSEKLRGLGLPVPLNEKVFVASHYRAVLDMLFRCIKQGNYPHHLDLDQWFDTEEQKAILKSHVQKMKAYLSIDEWNRVEQWLISFN